jgi:cytochrome c-type biogenesis protein CcmE
MPASPLDRELARALGSAAAGATSQSSAAQAKQLSGGASRARARGKGNIALLIVLLIMAGGIVALVMTSFKDAAVYAKTVDQVQANRAQLMGRRLRVEGKLVHGTLEKRDQPCEYRFVIKGADAELPVRFPQCVVPDTFRDMPGMDVGVTVEGKVAAAGGFEATQVLAKCPSKYEMKEKKEQGEQMPHTLSPSM